MAAFIYMADYVAFEESFDEYRPDNERIFRITSQKTQDGIEEQRRSSASVYLAPFIKQTFPEVESVTRVHILDNPRQTVIVDERGKRKKFEETRGFHAGPEYFRIFGDKLIVGNPDRTFDQPFNMVITSSLAMKYFGTVDALGKTVTLVDDETHQYQITGVVRDIPENSHFQYDYLISLKTLETLWPYARWTSWNWDYFHTYIKVKPNTNVKNLEKRLQKTVNETGREVFEAGNYSMDFRFQNIRDIHLFSNLGRELSQNGNGELLSYIYLIALFVLILAWVNYINLATATSSLRAKEIGIKKVSGAPISSLFNQFLIESLVINLLAFMVSCLFVLIAAEYLETWTDHHFSFLVFTDLKWLLAILSIVATGSLLSGIYPALILSRFQPLKIVKGNFMQSQQGITLRKALIILQFSVSLVLMVSTFGIYSQIDFLRNRDLGITLDKVLAVHAPNIRTESVWQEYDYLKSEALKESGISLVSASNQVPGNILYHTELFKKREQNTLEAKVAGMVWVDYDFLDLYGLRLIAGKDFRPEQSDGERGMIINQSMMELMGFSDPAEAVNAPATWVHSFGALTDVKIIGVVNDFDQRPMGTPQPMALLMNRFYRWREMGYYLYKIQSEQAEETIAAIREDFEETYPNEIFNAFFIDERFNQEYQNEARFGDVFSLFSLLAIFISNLGLFGLTVFVLSQRRKEMCIRKVLGATISNLVHLISRQLVTQMLVAGAIGMPVVYFGLESWLNRFAYRMDVSLLLFVVPFFTLIVISLATTIWQTGRTARMNPVANLRNE